MTDHVLTGRIDFGEVEAEKAQTEHNVDWDLRDLHFGRWECSCGETFGHEEEAAKHLYEEGQRT